MASYILFSVRVYGILYGYLSGRITGNLSSEMYEALTLTRQKIHGRNSAPSHGPQLRLTTFLLWLC